MKEEENCTKIEDDVKDCKGVVYLDKTDRDVLKCCNVNDEDHDDDNYCALRKNNEIRWALKKIFFCIHTDIKIVFHTLMEISL